MKNQPNRDYKSNDVVYTPEPLAIQILQHFNPQGKLLEPCKGNGAFYNNMSEPKDYCEIADDKDFFTYTDKVDWIITNPPWSQFKPFLKHSMELADNIVFLVTVNHLWTKARIKMINDAGFSIKEILLFDMPNTFPQSGFQLGAIHLQRGYTDYIKLSSLPHDNKG